MTDIATRYSQDVAAGIGPQCDWSLAGGDLVSDQSLLSAILIALFTDRLAAPDDELPDQSGDRRGWWGDAPLDQTARPAKADLIGSRLWLLVRQKQTEAVLTKAIGWAREALQWLIDDGVAQRVTVVGEWGGLWVLKLGITLSRITSNGGTVDQRYDVTWKATMNALGNPAGS